MELIIPKLEECDNVIIIKKTKAVGQPIVLFDSADYVKINGKVLKNRWGKTGGWKK